MKSVQFSWRSITAVAALSPNQRAWARFRRNRIGTWSLWLMAAMLRIRIMLTLAVTGGYTPSGERKAAGSPGTIPAAS